MAQQAYNQYGETRVISAIDARMSEVYTGFYELDEHHIMQAKTAERVLPPAAVKQHYLNNLTPDNLNPDNLTSDNLNPDSVSFDVNNLPYGVGTGWQAYPAELNQLKHNAGEPDILFPHAKAMLAIGEAAFNQNKAVSAEHAQPVYVRDTVSWKKLPGK